MRHWFFVILLFCAAVMVSCSQSGKQRQILSDAERIVELYPDSALSMVSDIDVSDIKNSDNRALYGLVVAAAHKAKESSMASDSLTQFTFHHYRDKDSVRFLKCGELYALHLFWNSNGESALALLDSLVALPYVTDGIEIKLLRTRVGIGGTLYDCDNNIRFLKRLLTIDNDSVSEWYYKQQLYLNYTYTGHADSALIYINELIDHAKSNHLSEEEFELKYEKIAVLEELGEYDEGNALADYIIDNAPDNSILHFVHLWKALNHFNMGEIEISTRELALADSCVQNVSREERKYYESFAGHLRNFLQYRKDGKIRIIQLAALTNNQRDNFFRMESTKVENEKNTLRAENRALELKSQNQRKTAIIIIVILIAVIIAITAVWNIQKRRRKIIEAEEQVDALNKMIEELKQPIPTSGHEALRRAMLQQLGIIKMVAETPTEQNREMLRKLSSIESDTNGSLVNWDNLYEIINNLYSNFYSKLHTKYADMLTEKEEQVIVLFVAGFSAKEISVITSQSTASIYVRKSSIKKKLDVPEKEDVIAFIRQELSV